MYPALSIPYPLASDDDLAHGIIARVHDESHVNRFWASFPPARVLTAAYMYPEVPSLTLSLPPANALDRVSLAPHRAVILFCAHMSSPVLLQSFRCSGTQCVIDTYDSPFCLQTSTHMRARCNWICELSSRARHRRQSCATARCVAGILIRPTHHHTLALGVWRPGAAAVCRRRAESSAGVRGITCTRGYGSPFNPGRGTLCTDGTRRWTRRTVILLASCSVFRALVLSFTNMMQTRDRAEGVGEESGWLMGEQERAGRECERAGARQVRYRSDCLSSGP